MTFKENNPKFYEELENKGERRPLNMLVSPHAGYIREYVNRDWHPMSDGIDDKICDGSNIINPGLRSGYHPDLPCYFCNLTNVGPVHFYCSEFIIINCKTCNLKLVVLLAHTMNISHAIYGKMLSKINELYPGYELIRDTEYNHFNMHIILGENNRQTFNEWHVNRRGMEE